MLYRKNLRNYRLLGSLSAFLVFVAVSACAGGFPEKWQMGFQKAQSPAMLQVTSFHNFLVGIQFFIAIVVGILMVYIITRFRKKYNETPSKTSHNLPLEITWTLIPLGIILYMMYPSLKLLYFMDIVPQADMTLKAVGHQWYWSYEYPDNEGIAFDSYMVNDSDLKPGQYRLLSTDNPVTLPIDTTVRIITTSDDVIHSWTVPSLGIKKDSVPGRLNETWLRINEPGTYFGQCSELCGPGHGFMPIEIKAVTKEEFTSWVHQQRSQTQL